MSCAPLSCPAKSLSAFLCILLLGFCTNPLLFTVNNNWTANLFCFGISCCSPSDTPVVSAMRLSRRFAPLMGSRFTVGSRLRFFPPAAAYAFSTASDMICRRVSVFSITRSSTFFLVAHPVVFFWIIKTRPSCPISGQKDAPFYVVFRPLRGKCANNQENNQKQVSGFRRARCFIISFSCWH